ncbi:MAG: hypothetical protein OK442_08600 [Thaumarchaeota archaeon]|nr:hypothetical protein [Nitrososphaerota archaeon]
MNSDPRIIAVFMTYLRTKDIEESRIRARMTIHVRDDKVECKGYWKKVTSLNDANFISTVVKNPSLSKGAFAIRHHRNQLQLARATKADQGGNLRPRRRDF